MLQLFTDLYPMRGGMGIYIGMSALVLVLMLSGCRGSRVSGKAGDVKSTEGTVEQLQFVSFYVSKDTVSGKTIIALTNIQSVSGSMKSDRNGGSIRDYVNNLGFYQYCNGILVDSIFMAHPLYFNVELMDGQSALQTKAVTLATATMFIRLRKGSGPCELRIFETLHNIGTHPLTIIKL